MMPGRHLCYLTIIIVGAFCSPCADGEVVDPSKATAEAGSDTLWYDLRLLDVEGRGWTATTAFYDRLPARAEGIV